MASIHHTSSAIFGLFSRLILFGDGDESLSYIYAFNQVFGTSPLKFIRREKEGLT